MTNPMPLFGTSEGDWAAYQIAHDKVVVIQRDKTKYIKRGSWLGALYKRTQETIK